MLRSRLLLLPEFDMYLAKALQLPTRTKALADLAVHVVTSCVLREPAFTYNELTNTIDTLARLAANSGNAQVMGLMEQARRAAAVHVPPAQRLPTEVPAAARDRSGDSPGLAGQATSMLEEWLRLSTFAGDAKVRV